MLSIDDLRQIIASGADAHMWPAASDYRLVLEDLRETIELETLAPPRLRLLRDNAYHDPRVLRRIVNNRLVLGADYTGVERAVLKDSTLVIDNIGAINGAMFAVCDEVSALVGRKCPGNLYCAAKPKSGFGAHSDQHHVLVIQLAGKKRWFIPSGPPKLVDCELVAGDVLFIRENVLHDVKALDLLSIHISIALN